MASCPPSSLAARQLTLSTSPALESFTTQIRSRSSTSSFFVSVPVLSEHRMSMPAISSMALRRCTMAFSWLSSYEPTARAVVTTRGIATGRVATRMTMAVFRLVAHSTSSRKSCTKKIGITPTSPSVHMILATVPSRCCTLPCSVTVASNAIVFPKNVSTPVAVTIMLNSPCTTTAPLRTSSPGNLVTGRDSPVSELSSIIMGSPSPTSRPSEGITTPAASSIRSPGTSSLTSTSTHSPSRLARQCGADISLRAFTASAAFFSER
mmetsp:Transcript_8599/g.17442  ORF Transcript_8599/g.17442 Transcript_8599/m.17442 type:complete len:265 (-) Transcript_8599:652-1446(-)